MSPDSPGSSSPRSERDLAIDRYLTLLLDVGAEERPDKLESVPADLRDDVEAMLAAALAPDEFLQRGGGMNDHLLDSIPSDDEDIRGQRIGPYRLVEEIGAGGMGRVYLGERADGMFERQVAIKVVHLDASPPDRDALLRELEILAGLDHPGIARLYDAGLTPNGDPFVVMERILEGKPIDQYCDAHTMGTRGRLGLIVDACSAVEAAHQQLVVHRDLKPSNILVDKDGLVKLLDFGISRILASPSVEVPPSDSLYADGGETEIPPADDTHRRSWLTPRYASPELLRREAVTTASDVYQLGLLICLLLRGHLPGQEDHSMAGPSGFELAPSLETQGIPLADLAAIVGKCLASDASDRYGSADRLREDLMNLLTGRPVRAAPPSRTYSLRRFLGRHRLAVSLATALILTLLGLVAAFTWRLAKERDATRREAIAAEKASLESQRVLNFLTEIFQTADPLSSLNPALGKSNVSARELLDRAVLRLQGSLVDQPLLRARILTVVGGVYRALGLGDQAEPLLREGLALREAAPGDHQLELADSWQALGRLEEQRGSYDEARDLLEQAVDTFRALGETTRLGSALQNLGTVQFDQADNENAVLSLTEAVAIHRSTENYDREAESRVSLANALVQLRRPEEAQEHLERGLAVLEAERGDHHPSLVAPLVALASLHSDAGHPADALPILHRASALLSESLGTEDFRLAVIENNLGIAQSRLGNYEEAQKHLGTALVGFERWRGDHPDIGEILNNLGAMEWELHHPKQAETFYRRALEILRKTYPDEHPAVSRVVFNLGEALLGQEDLDGAEIELSHSLELFEAKMGTDHPMVSYPLLYLAQIAETKGQASRAESYFERSLDIRRKVKGAAPSFVDEVRDAYAEFLRKQGRPADALALVDD